MRLAFVCFYEAYPPASGAASVTFNTAKHAGCEAIIVQLMARSQPERIADGVRVITLPCWSDSRVRKLAALQGTIRRITAVLECLAPDVVVLQGASWALYHLLMLRRIRRRLPQARVAYHAHNVEYVLRKQKHGRLVTAITRSAEGRVLREADLCFAVSDVDAHQFENLYGIRPKLLPNGVDCERFDRVTPDQIRAMRQKYSLGDRTVLFMGLYAYRPNREGADFLVESVMPQVVRQCPDTKLVIIGGEVPYERPWLINPGRIPYEEVAPAVQACRVGVAPVFSGSGTRLKILEYLAGSRAVVSTAKGAEGLDLQNGRDLLLAEDADAFSSAIVRLLQDRALAESLGANGQRVVNARYAWPVLMQAFRETVFGASRV